MAIFLSERFFYNYGHFLHPAGSASAPALIEESFVPLFYNSPVHYMEPVVNIGCADIIVFQIIGMFPYVNIQKGMLSS